MSPKQIIAGGRSMNFRDQSRIDAREPLSAGYEPDMICIAKATDWQDAQGFPGWEPEAGATALFKGIAGTMPAGFLADGGYLHIFSTGIFTNNSTNPNLLLRLGAWTDFYGASPSETYIGPTDASGELGWGFSNSATGTGNFTASGRFVFDLKIHSLGTYATNTLLAIGHVRVSALYPQDGGMDITLPAEQRIEIYAEYDLDLLKEYELTTQMGSRVSAGGADFLHVDSMEIWGFGGRKGLGLPNA